MEARKLWEINGCLGHPLNMAEFMKVIGGNLDYRLYWTRSKYYKSVIHPICWGMCHTQSRKMVDEIIDNTLGSLRQEGEEES